MFAASACSNICKPPVAQVSPKGDLVLIATAEAEDKTTGGVLLPATAQRKPTSGAQSPSNQAPQPDKHLFISSGCMTQLHQPHLLIAGPL